MATKWRRIAPEAASAHPLYGVRGWLFALVAMMTTIGPLVAMSRVHAGFTVTERHLEALAPMAPWVQAKLAAWSALAGFELLSVAGGILLMLGRGRGSVRLAAGAIWLSGPVALAVINLLIPAWISGNLDFVDDYFLSGFKGPLIASVAVAAGWTAYLARSRRVRVTYVHEVTDSGR